MYDYLNKLLHIKSEVFEFTQTDKFPLYIKNNYSFHIIKLAGVECLVAKPKGKINFASLRKQQQLLKNESGMECVLSFEKLNQYAKNKMLAEGIPFIIEGKQVYMPFLGIVIAQNVRQPKETGQISFLTQKLLLSAIYQKWNKVFLFEAARHLAVSDMSVSRCFDEIEAVGLPLIFREGRGRFFIWNGKRKELWDLIFPFLRNPISKKFLPETEMATDKMLLGGLSAISHYSMLADNAFTTYAVTKAELKELPLLNKLGSVPKGEIPAMVVQVMHYIIPFSNGEAIDPLTAILTVNNEERSDPRVKAAIDEILEEYLVD